MKSSISNEYHQGPDEALTLKSSESSIQVPNFMIPALRSDHAGEAGAVEIYRGILALTQDESVREFARQHLATERRHLAQIEAILPVGQQTHLLVLCRWAGWLTGALPALFGTSAVHRTIDAVETFVDEHYHEQIEQLSEYSEYVELREMLEGCRQDEIAHRDDARKHLGQPSWIGGLWTWLVTQGSHAGVNLVLRF